MRGRKNSSELPVQASQKRGVAADASRPPGSGHAAASGDVKTTTTVHDQTDNRPTFDVPQRGEEPTDEGLTGPVRQAQPSRRRDIADTTNTEGKAPTMISHRIAPMTAREEGAEPIDYNDKNIRLFEQRQEVKNKIDVLRAKPEKRRTILEKRDLARLTRELDDVTTQIIQFNYGLVRSYTKKFTSNSSREDSADFEASAVVGLMRAIETFDPSKGRFGQWAYKPIQREVLRSVRDADFKSMNPGDFERRPDILRALHKLQAGDEARFVSHDAVAAAAGVTVDQVKRVLEAPHLDSIHQHVGEDGDTELGDLIESGDVDTEGSVIASMTLTALEDYGLRALDPRELLVLVRRFGLDCEPEQKLASIGEVLGLSREAVRQVESKALAKIQHPVVLRKIHRYGRG